MEDRKGVISAVRNPLSIIALFLFLVEVVVTIALRVEVLTETQRMWLVVFCVIFPVIVLLFLFIFVWFKPQHLYGPLDYDNQKDYLDSLRFKKIQDEVRIIDKGSNSGNLTDLDNNGITYLVIRAMSIACKNLEQEYGKNNVSRFVPSHDYLYDGIVRVAKERIVFDVKYIEKNSSIEEFVSRVNCFASIQDRYDMRLVAFVTDTRLPERYQDLITKRIAESYPKLMLRFYSF